MFGKAIAKKLSIESQHQEQAGRRNLVAAKYLRHANSKVKLQSRRKKGHVLSTGFSCQ